MGVRKFRYIKPELFTHPIPFDDIGKSLITSSLLEYLCIHRIEGDPPNKNIMRNEIIMMGDEVHEYLCRIYAILEGFCNMTQFHKIKTSYHSEAFAMYLFIAQESALLIGRNYFGSIVLKDNLNTVFDPYATIMQYQKMGTFAPIFDTDALREDKPRIVFNLDPRNAKDGKTLKETILQIIARC